MIMKQESSKRRNGTRRTGGSEEFDVAKESVKKGNRVICPHNANSLGTGKHVNKNISEKKCLKRIPDYEMIEEIYSQQITLLVYSLNYSVPNVSTKKNSPCRTKSTDQIFHLSPHPERCRRDSSGRLLPLSLDVLFGNMGRQDNHISLSLRSAGRTGLPGGSAEQHRPYRGAHGDLCPARRAKKADFFPRTFSLSGAVSRIKNTPL